LAAYNEGQRCLPQFTETGNRIVGAEFVCRGYEYDSVAEALSADSPNVFGDVFTQAYKAEIDALVRYGGGDADSLDEWMRSTRKIF